MESVSGVLTPVLKPVEDNRGDDFTANINDGKLVRPALGIQAAPPQLHATLKLPKGVAVLGVAKGGAAEAAGVRPFQRGAAGEIVAGDIITALGGKPVTSLDELLEALEQHRPGDTVKLSVLRAGKPVELSVRLGLPDQLQ